MARLAEFGLRVPDLWYALPDDAGGDETWADGLAARILDGVEPSVPGAESLMARQLVEVRDAVAGTGAPNVRVAVLVSDPTSLLIDAMLTVSMEHDVQVESYVARLDTVVDQVEDSQVMGVQPVEAEATVGHVRGAHFLIGHLPEDEADAASPLEERVHLGVFPHGTNDLVDVMVIAASPVYFEDLPTTVVNLLAGLEVSTETVA